MGIEAGCGPAVTKAAMYWLVGASVDFRCGAERLLVQVREALGHNPLDGSAFVFRNRRSTRIKVLRVDGQGVWLATRRLHGGRFCWVSTHEPLASLTHRQFRWLRADRGVCSETEQ